MTRIAVIGNAAGGKITLSSHLARYLSLPVYNLDDELRLPDGTATPRSVLAERQREWLRQPGWIINGGGPWELLIERLAAADTVVFVDHPIHVHYWWLGRHHWRRLFRAHTVPARGSAAPISLDCYWAIWQTHRRWRPRLVQHLHQLRGRKRIIHLRSPLQLQRFLRRVEVTVAPIGRNRETAWALNASTNKSRLSSKSTASRV